MIHFDSDKQRTLFSAIAGQMIDHADELTALDQAIGDGDHGVNMKRGFEAVQAEMDTLVSKPFADALKALGMQLVLKIGGASGPLYGTLFMSIGKAAGESLSFSEFGAAMASANKAVMARGKSDVGAKTMLDVLVPVANAMQDGADPSEVSALAAASAEKTVAMQATRGRASFLGERSIGHMDPGARSAQLLIDTLCRFYSEHDA